MLFFSKKVNFRMSGRTESIDNFLTNNQITIPAKAASRVVITKYGHVAKTSFINRCEGLSPFLSMVMKARPGDSTSGI